MNDLLLKTLLLICGAALLFFGLRYFEKSSLYFPIKKLDGTPADIGLEYEDVNIVASDGVKIHGWFIPAEYSPRYPRINILFSHGNGGNISHRFAKLQMLHKLGFDTLIYDYRGYGKSEGSPDEDGIYLDIEAVYDHLLNNRQVNPKNIILFGESLGSAVSADLALKREVGGIVIEEGFTSVKDVANHYFPFIPNFIYKSKYDTSKKLKKVAVPKLMFHSVDDEIIPYGMGKRLFDAAAEPKQFIELKGGHNDAFMVSQDKFMKGIDEFVGGL